MSNFHEVLERERLAELAEKRRIAAINAKRVTYREGFKLPYDARTTREVAETRKVEMTPKGAIQRRSRKARRQRIVVPTVAKDKDGAYRRFNRLDEAA